VSLILFDVYLHAFSLHVRFLPWSVGVLFSRSLHVRSLLARCIIHPQYVLTHHGNRFLSFALNLHAPFIEPLMMAIREQVHLSLA
jgi:hypothetical protein